MDFYACLQPYKGVFCMENTVAVSFLTVSKLALDGELVQAGSSPQSFERRRRQDSGLRVNTEFQRQRWNSIFNSNQSLIVRDDLIRLW